MKKVLMFVMELALLFAAVAIPASAQTAPVQHFVLATSTGNFNGSPVAIASSGIQVTKDFSVAYEYISNPNDSSKPRVGSGVANYTFGVDKVLPKSLKSKLLLDLSNYNLTLQGGAGVESLSLGAGLGRTGHIVGNFGVYGSYPLPGGHTQIGLGYKFVVGQGSVGLVKVPAGTLNFTF